MTHQLQNLNIRAFRQLKDVELQDLRRVNLLVGLNNSGKTSVLEAIAAHCQPLEPLHWLAIARQRGIKSSREPALDAVRWLFPQHGAEPEDPYYRGQVRIESSGKYPNLETIVRYEGIVGTPEVVGTGSYNQDDDEEEDSSGSSLSATPPPDEGHERGADIFLRARVPRDQWLVFDAEPDGFCDEKFRLWETERYVSQVAPSGLRLPVATISPFAHRVQQLQVSQLSDATLRGRKFSIIEVVQLIDPSIEDLEILSRTGIRPTLYVRHKRTGFTPLSALGDGVRRVIAIALSLGSVQHGALLVDEVETAIHKDALSTIFQWLVRACKYFDVQLFATTHSLEAIDALLTAQIDEPAEIVAFQLPERGEGTIKRFDGEILDNLRFERGLDIR